MTRNILLLIILLTGCSIAPEYNVETGLVCYDNNDKQIIVIKQRTKHFAVATFNRNLQRREIIISEVGVAPAVLEFIVLHECGHHQLNHVDISDTPKRVFLWSSKLMREEQEADCFAKNAYIAIHGLSAFNELLHELASSNLLDSKRFGRILQCN